MKWLEFEDYVDVIIPVVGINILLGILFQNIFISLIILLISIFIIISALKFRNYRYQKKLERKAKKEVEIERLKNKFE